jgi:hypothetical protein
VLSSVSIPPHYEWYKDADNGDDELNILLSLAFLLVDDCFCVFNYRSHVMQANGPGVDQCRKERRLVVGNAIKKKSAFQELRRDDRMNSHVPQCPTNVIGHIGAMSSQSMEWLRCVAARTSFELELYPYS